jgi:LysR family glycine cleavage system transcriptional activator
VPRLDDFHAKHPTIELRLLATRRLVDFRTEDVDVAVRFGDGNHPGLVADRLMSESLIPVARRDLAAKIKKPADLVKCTLLEDDWHTENRAFPDWTTWLATLGVESREGFHIHYFGEHNLVIQAALTGLGAALTFKSLVDDDLKAGRLVQLLNHSIPSNLAYHLVMPKPHGDYNKVIAFRSWLLEQCGSFATN